MSINDQRNMQNNRPPDTADGIDIQNDTPEIFCIGSSDFILIDEVVENNEKPLRENFKEITLCLVKKTKTTFTCKNMTKRLPILKWLPNYNSKDCIGDLLAGITIGLTVIPQSMAYAALAGLPLEQGLYGSFLGSLIYVFIGSCKEVAMGPTAIVSLMTYNTVRGLGPLYATLLCFLTGVIQLIIGVVGLGFLIDFISGPVNAGFTSAVAIIIISSQIKHIIGIKVIGSNLIEIFISICKNVRQFQIGDTLFGTICLIIILLLRKMTSCHIGPKDGNEQTKFHKFVNRTMWLIGAFRNSIIVIITTYISYVFVHSTGHDVTSDLKPPIPFEIIGKIQMGLPNFDAPKFSYINDDNTEVTFFEMVLNLGSGVIVLPIIALIENFSICKTFANGQVIDTTQEIFAIGLCNIGNSFFHAFPGSGSFSRSALNAASGVRTPLSSLYTGILVIVSLLFCTPYFYYLPKSALAAIIITAVIFMVEIRVVKPIYRSKKSDLIPGLGTFFACLLLPLELGILIGVGLNSVSILYHAARPKLSIKINTTRSGINYLMMTPDRCLIFPSVEYVRNIIVKHSLKQKLPVVIDCSHIYGADFTAAKVIELLTKDFSKRGQLLFFYNLKPSLVAVFKGVYPSDFNVFYDSRALDQLLQKCMPENKTSED